MQRLAIEKVGTVALVDGSIDASGWEFKTPLLGGDETVGLDPEAGGLAGWSGVELHAIAHGVPCDCGIAQVGD